jgi:hypothetical protein
MDILIRVQRKRSSLPGMVGQTFQILLIWGTFEDANLWQILFPLSQIKAEDVG